MKFADKLGREVQDHLKTLEAIYFLVHQLQNNAERLVSIRKNYPLASREQRLGLRDQLRDEVKWVRDETGAIAPSRQYQNLLSEIRACKGYFYLDKLSIDRNFFTNYVRFFPRWNHIRLHAAVIFDGQKDEGTGQIYELEGPRLQDAREFLKRSQAAEKGIEDFRNRARDDQLECLMFARASLLSSMAFIETYLNGIAYDCFIENHDSLSIDDHDLLAEWDSSKKRRRFVEFRDKVFRYPVIAARCRGRTHEMSGCKPAHQLVGFAKDYRDALVHPSPFIDPNTKQYGKFLVALGVNRRVAEGVLDLVVEYAQFVEKGISNDPKKSAPWLYDE